MRETGASRGSWQSGARVASSAFQGVAKQEETQAKRSRSVGAARTRLCHQQQLGTGQGSAAATGEPKLQPCSLSDPLS